MNVKKLATEMDAMVAKGAIVDAVKAFFAEEASTADYGDSVTANKAEMVGKMEKFVAAIARVNGIQHHKTLADDLSSASEFTFDFDMKDGTKIYWHEIIRRDWNLRGEVIREEYFNAS